MSLAAQANAASHTMPALIPSVQPFARKSIRITFVSEFRLISTRSSDGVESRAEECFCSDFHCFKLRVFMSLPFTCGVDSVVVAVDAQLSRHL